MVTDSPSRNPGTRLSRVRAWLRANRLPLGLFAVAFLIRFLYLLDYGQSPFFQGHIADALYHEDWALRILDGDVWGTRLPGVFYKAPLYPYFIALMFLVSGKSEFFLMVVQVALASFSCVLLFQIGKRRLGAAAAAVAALLYAGYFPSVYFSTEMEIPTLAIFLTLWSFHLLDGEPRLRSVVSGAVVFGLSLLALPTNLFLLPLYTVMLVNRRGGWRAGLRLAVAFVGITFAMVLPCTLRNWWVGGHPTLISANGGLNFHIGNNAEYDRTVYLQPGYEFERFYDEPRRQAGADSFVARDRYWYAKTFAFIAAHPVHEAGLLLKKVALYFANYEIYRNTDTYYAKDESLYRHIPFFPASFILAAGFAGLGLSLYRRQHGALIAFGVLQALPCLVFFVTDRYRLPSMSVWVLFAGAFVVQVGQGVKARAVGAAVLAIGGVGILVVGSNLNGFVVKNPAYRPHLNLGFIYESRAVYDLAVAEYTTALGWLQQQRPRDEKTESELHARIGNVHLTKGELALAGGAFAAAVASDPQSTPAYSYLGSLYEKQNRYEDAARMFARALALNPWDGVSCHNFGLLLLRMQQADAAIFFIKRAIDLTPGNASAYSDLAYAYGTQDKPDLMEATAKTALYYDARNIPALYNLASLYVNTGRTDEAIAHYRTIIAVSPKDSANAQNQLGVLCAQKGDLKQAMFHWEQALVIEPGNESVRSNLQRAKWMAR